MKSFHAKYELNMERMCKRLHIDGDSFSDECSRKIIPDLKKIAETNMDINVWYMEGNGDFRTGMEEVDACEKQIVCLVYSSQKIMDILEEMSAKGDYLELYLLNDLTNDMLFNASNQLNEYLAKGFKEEGLFLTRKFFPGEGDVPLELQKNLFDLLKKERDFDLDINSSYMLIPEKSMMYAFGADKNNEEVPWQHDCGLCSREDCFFRENGEKTGFCPR